MLNVYGNPNHHYEIYLNTWDNIDKFRVGYRAGGYGDESSIDCVNNDCSNRPDRGKWYMITYTFGKETVTNTFTGQTEEVYKTYTYLNGQLAEEKTPSNNWNNSMPTDANLILGGEKFEGILDDLRIYDGALDSAEVAELYHIISYSNL